MKTIKEWLTLNPREKSEAVELELLYMGINLYHILSLLWERTTRKYTNEFIIYKTQEILETFINNLPEDVPFEIVEQRISDARNAIQEDAKNIETVMMFFGAEIDNYPGSNYGLTLDFKIGILLYALELKGISREQILAKYQN
jgi:hypothetical protein